ncbi:MAG: hypothetical protein HY286_00455 [Planctomycetes bacterium]|nr:hypothetical protein [Planctomycetota bacterium]
MFQNNRRVFVIFVVLAIASVAGYAVARSANTESSPVVAAATGRWAVYSASIQGAPVYRIDTSTGATWIQQGTGANPVWVKIVEQL